MNKFRSTAAAALSLIAVALLAGCGSSSSYNGSSATQPSSANPSGANPTSGGPALAAATVKIVSFKFMPPTITVKQGGSVAFPNNDSAAHTATADDRSFDSQTIGIGKSKTVTFSKAGQVPYHCDFHPFMKGTIVVK